MFKILLKKYFCLKCLKFYLKFCYNEITKVFMVKNEKHHKMSHCSTVVSLWYSVLCRLPKFWNLRWWNNFCSCFWLRRAARRIAYYRCLLLKIYFYNSKFQNIVNLMVLLWIENRLESCLQLRVEWRSKSMKTSKYC